MNDTLAGSTVAWALDGKVHQVDSLKERAIEALETIESILSEAAHSGRFDILSNTIRCFAMINSVLVEESKQRWQADHPGQKVM